jgi:hypothetical protein
MGAYRTTGPALSISKGTDRDRAVDESGNHCQCSAAAAQDPSIAQRRHASICTMENPTRSLLILRSYKRGRET